MSRYGSQYQVSRPTGLCAATGRALEPGSTCIATLCEQPDGDGFDRLDFSIEAWEAGGRPERLFSFWKTVVDPPDVRRRVFVDDDVLMDLFLRLEGEDGPQRVAFRFVIALILMRKRHLKFVGRTDGAGGEPRRWRLRAKGAEPDEPLFEVVNPELDDEDVRELTAQLGEILRGEL